MLKYNIHHVNGLYFEIVHDGNNNEREYDCTFFDRGNNKTIYQTKLKAGSWSKLNRKYLSDIVVYVRYKDRIVTEVSILKHLHKGRVFIVFDSKSLGDTLAWMPYCLEFQKMYECELYVSTFHNYLFESKYPTLTFMPRGAVVHNLTAMFEIGWFFDADKEPEKPNLIALQKAASNILMLDYKEIRPEMVYVPSNRPIMSKYVCISTQSTAALKHWNYWQEVINYLKSKDYVVYEMSKDASEYDGLDEVLDKTLPTTMNYLHHADFFIGLSSGISWLAWALRKKVIMISNFTLAEHEFSTDCIRITDESICHGCWNNPMFRFNKGDWNWCPEHEDTPRHLECHKLIPAQKVIHAIDSIIKV